VNIVVKTGRAALVALALFAPATAARADVVLSWNEIAVQTLIQQGQNPFAQARFAAIVQVAVFEAVNAVTGEYEPYIGIAPAPGASVDAAAATAAYRVLKTYFPAASNLDPAYAASLAAIPEDSSKADGIAAGEAAAAALTANRQNDGSSPAMVSPVGDAAPGVWQLTTPGCASTATGGVFYHWRNVRPFGIPSAAAFMPAPPPLLVSSEFAKDYDEVRRVGSVASAERPQDRSDVARFFGASSPTLVLNMAARQAATAQGRSTSDNARALALLNMATTDALVSSMMAKYHYNFWRPETAIRYADGYGNPKVIPEFGWAPFITTPCFPSYPSNHASGTNAGAEILRRLYGEGGHAITLVNPFSAAVSHLELTYSSFNEMSEDVDDARIYGGIHFRFDQVAGSRLGREVATFVYKNNLRKVGSN
jgi:hypothetical protein